MIQYAVKRNLSGVRILAPGQSPEVDEVIYSGELPQPDGVAGLVVDGEIARLPNATEAITAAKAFRTESNRAECSRRIFDRYPAGRQLSALAGLYDSANVATMTDWIAANIAAENTAADAIEAATTVAEVEAVTVAWPA